MASVSECCLVWSLSKLADARERETHLDSSHAAPLSLVWHVFSALGERGLETLHKKAKTALSLSPSFTQFW